MTEETNINTSESHSEESPIDKSLKLKELGNFHFKNGEYHESIALFSKAIEFDPNNAVFYCNRSMSYAAIGEYENSVLDARQAIDKRPEQGYVKAYYYLIKGLIELKLYQKAKANLLAAFNRCGSAKELNLLEDLLMSKCGGHPIRPRPNDFLILDDLGDGNFTKVVKAQYKKTKYVYAIKTIDKQTVERTKRRHPNIYNEIMMEKRVITLLPTMIRLHTS
jgi:tetratricopeptide (TPR) repeat protein